MTETDKSSFRVRQSPAKKQRLVQDAKPQSNNDLPAQRKDRVIIALDLDAFYVAACRKRDPTLNNLPVAIKQKHIVATCSYEARAFGVKKLGLIKDAVRQCPELILVNGEDLSYFRKVSMEIFHLVSSMVKGAIVEKLGMDELFCDVTEMVDEMMAEQASERQDWLGKQPYGVILPLQTQVSVAQNGNTAYNMETMTQRLLLGTHIAQSLRDCVAERVGLTSSAGISTSKYLAKLVGNTNKPNKQTVFAPLHQTTAQQDVQTFLNPFPVRSLNGFGSVITEKMCEQAIKTLGMPEQSASTERLTVLVAREIYDYPALQALFGVRLADRLHGLLHGIDNDPVIKAPEFPAQISIEDTYQGLDFSKVPEQFLILSKSLLKRLEVELLAQRTPPPSAMQQKAARMVERPYDAVGDPLDVGDGPGRTQDAAMTVRDYDQDNEQEQDEKIVKVEAVANWKRYPLTMRLSVRQGYTNRISRQTRMPVDVFDLHVDRAVRAGVLAQSCEALFKTIIKQEGNKGQGLHLINIAALDLSVHRPAGSIGKFFRTSTVIPADRQHDVPCETAEGPNKKKADETSGSVGAPMFDVQFLLELPRDLRIEVAAEYGIRLEELEELNATQINPGASISPLELSQQSSSGTIPIRSSLSDSKAHAMCDECGQKMSFWLQHDHQRWPRDGLPTKLDDEEHEIEHWDQDEAEEESVSSSLSL